MALTAIGMHAKQIEMLLGKLPFGSDEARDIAEAINKIRRHVKPEGTPPGVERTEADAMQLAARQNAMRLQQMRQQAAASGGAAGGQPPHPAAAA